MKDGLTPEPVRVCWRSTGSTALRPTPKRPLRRTLVAGAAEKQSELITVGAPGTGLIEVFIDHRPAPRLAKAAKLPNLVLNVLSPVARGNPRLDRAHCADTDQRQRFLRCPVAELLMNAGNGNRGVVAMP